MSNRTPAPNNQPTRIVVVGASGRMGARLCQLALGDARFALAAALCRPGSAHSGSTIAPAHALQPAVKISDSAGVLGPSSADVVIDFSSEAGTHLALEAAQRSGAALLVGTTALPPATRELLRAESTRRAVLLAPNTSLGVAALADLVRRAAAALTDFDCSIVEAHHNQKKDAPSGTALRLAQAAREAGARLPDEQVVAIRGGDVVGEHTVRFAGQGEYIELTHRATSRDLFVRGALRAAAWLQGRQPGWWTMEDALGFASR